MSNNVAEITGRLTAAPEARQGPRGEIAVLNIETFYQRPAEDGGREEASQTHRAVIFDPAAARKALDGWDVGTLVNVRGKLDYSKYKHPETGEDRIGTEIHVAGSQGLAQKTQGRAAGDADINRVSLTGNLGADPVMTDGPEGPIAFLRLATTERWGKPGAEQEKTQWHSVAVFEPGLAEYARDHLKAGSFVTLGGGSLRHTKREGADGKIYRGPQIQLSGSDARLKLVPMQKKTADRRNDQAPQRGKSR